jgi:hypothetical protein
LDAADATVFSLSFQANEIAEAPGRRASDGTRSVEIRPTVPDQGVGQAAAVLRSEGPDAVRLVWDASRHPLAVARDPRSGQILSFAHGGVGLLSTRAAEVEVLLSDGVRGTSRRLVRNP